MTWVQAPAYVTLGKLLDMPDLVSLSIKIGITGLVASQCRREAGTIHCKKTLQSPLELILFTMPSFYKGPYSPYHPNCDLAVHSLLITVPGICFL